MKYLRYDGQYVLHDIIDFLWFYSCIWHLKHYIMLLQYARVGILKLVVLIVVLFKWVINQFPHVRIDSAYAVISFINADASIK